ncbi:MAG: 4-hydroxy-tetrahydrodipicolinate reductase [Clostridia bacterium]|nr:4-hydroxy-tetrahydrodipicolinate reductase [Clostridia bacterium]MBN2883999.1 4-hydroxy-tetrahydrodipicolinate reductase [Clostridia bacterium]
MTRILLSGCSGRMGQVIASIARTRSNVEIVAGFDVNTAINSDFPVYSSINDCPVDINVVIDFSNPAAFNTVTGFCLMNKIPLVMATTGLTEEQISNLSGIAEKSAVFHSANMSMGVNLVMELAKKAASFTEGLFDIEIIEKHHGNKIDAPSGTALAIANAINDALDDPKETIYDRTLRREKRDSLEMGIHTIRGGTIVGEHTIIFAGNDEIIEIKHEALSRNIFAEGALKAAVFISDKTSGLFSMSDMINDG